MFRSSTLEQTNVDSAQKKPSVFTLRDRRQVGKAIANIALGRRQCLMRLSSKYYGMRSKASCFGERYANGSNPDNPIRDAATVVTRAFGMRYKTPRLNQLTSDAGARAPQAVTAFPKLPQSAEKEKVKMRQSRSGVEYRRKSSLADARKKNCARNGN